MKRRPVLRVLGFLMFPAFLLAGAAWTQEPFTPRQAAVEQPRGTDYASVPLSMWRIETVDTEGWAGVHNSLALDSAGWPHISYNDELNHKLKYAYKDAAGWHIETVVSFGGRYNSLALDSSDWPHISFYDHGYGDLYYAYKDATGWHYEMEDGISTDVGQYTSLALLNGQPHISYYDATFHDLLYFYKDALGVKRWETMDTAGDVGRFSSLALDSSGRPNISYYDYTNGNLKWAFKDSLGGHAQAVDTDGDVGREFTSLVLRQTLPVKLLHISYIDATQSNLKYAYTDALGWHIEAVGYAGPLFGPTSLAVESLGRPHICVHNYYGLGVIYAYKKDAWTWQFETVDVTGGDWYEYNLSLALDSSNRPHLSYYDDANHDLKYAYKVYGVFLPLVLRG